MVQRFWHVESLEHSYTSDFVLPEPSKTEENPRSSHAKPKNNISICQVRLDYSSSSSPYSSFCHSPSGTPTPSRTHAADTYHMMRESPAPARGLNGCMRRIRPYVAFQEELAKKKT